MNWLNLLSMPFVFLLALGCGRSVLRWTVLAYLFGFWALIPLIFLPKKPMKPIVIHPWLESIFRYFFIKHTIRKIETPKDLFEKL